MPEPPTDEDLARLERVRAEVERAGPAATIALYDMKSLLAGYDRALAEVARLRSELGRCRAELRHHAGRNYD